MEMIWQLLAFLIAMLCASGPIMALGGLVSALPSIWGMFTIISIAWIVALVVLCGRVLPCQQAALSKDADVLSKVPKPMAEQKTKQRLVLITGANRGIGFELAKLLAADDRYCVILTARDLDAGRKAAEELGAAVIVLHLDVLDADSVLTAALFVKHQFGRLDVLVNNAGVSPSRAGAACSCDERKRIVNTNAIGMLTVSDAFRDLLIASRCGGHIVNVGSRRGRLVADTCSVLKSRAAL
eukprot:gnl/TRDRNA2_/TRDRNA2_174774_c0_seq5.p1 gnl/TRDRNA2_/TRDRNA2_174774_c0~~gnl/TRDRNA2_/TRDRNA2_174774_c0_seq5.p1  ORF type:complete len:240 (-),score=39.23 gnl/TRDRNA2_/TRDRNA2_174774_c0_seq5:23-742(-)